MSDESGIGGGTGCEVRTLKLVNSTPKIVNYVPDCGYFSVLCMFRSKTAGVPEQIGRPTGAK